MSLLKEPKFLEEEKDAPLLNLHQNNVLLKVFKSHIKTQVNSYLHSNLGT